LSGCAQWSSTPVERELAELQRQGFVAVEVQPQLKAWLKQTEPTAHVRPSAVLHVYLEGDGAAWWGQRLPPADPTPRTSVALPLALADTHSAVAYLARPCQYLTRTIRTGCPVAWWTSERWGEPVIAMTAHALNTLLKTSGARELVLIGHSGGGTLALLVAPRQRDVRCVVTLAAPLDLNAWAQAHGLTPFAASANPAELPMPNGRFQERHLLGQEDRVVPLSSLGRYAARLPAEHVLTLPNQGHGQGWVQQWQTLRDASGPLSGWLSGCLAPA
jgi:pimeloyl-ACP methyl ester carboxylesterase